MIYKSYILEQNFQTLNKHKLFLFYGENNGLKDEFKKTIRKKSVNRNHFAIPKIIKCLKSLFSM